MSEWLDGTMLDFWRKMARLDNEKTGNFRERKVNLMPSVQHHTSADYPNGKEETRKMFEYAAQLRAAEEKILPADNRETFQDAVRNDPDMTPEQKAKWLQP